MSGDAEGSWRLVRNFLIGAAVGFFLIGCLVGSCIHC